MHNLHFVVVYADSFKEAVNIVKNKIEDFGDENSWWSIGGAVHQENGKDVISAGDWFARFYPCDKKGEEYCQSIEEINKFCKATFQAILEEYKIRLAQFDKEELENPEKLFKNINQRLNLYRLSKSMEDVWNLAHLPVAIEKFDVLKHCHRSYEYDKFGVTRLQSAGKHQFIVFLDMHS